MFNFRPWIVVVLGLCAMGVWGCGQQKTGAIGAKVRELETRYGKLEEDFRTLQSTNDQNRKRWGLAEAQRDALETEKTELTKKYEDAVKERDAVKAQVSLRTQERDSAQTTLMQFSKDLQALAGRVEASVNSPQTGTIIPASR